MKKLIALLLSLILVFTLTGCSDKTPSTVNKKKTTNNYVLEHAVPKDLPIYPDAVLNRGFDVTKIDIDEETGEEIEEIHWAWTFSTTASANEIIEFYKKELTKLGYGLKNEDLHANNFSLFTIDSNISVSNAILGKSNRDTLPDIVMPDTPGRDYTIQINPEKWQNK